MNTSQTYITGLVIMLTASLSHAIFNSFSAPLEGVFLLANFIGLSIILTTAALENDILESKHEEAGN